MSQIDMTSFFVIYFAYLCDTTIGDIKQNSNLPSINVNVVEPLFLTPLIEAGKIDEAKKKAAVHQDEMIDVESYAGYLTINKQYNSNTFFWYFPAKKNSENAPVLIWLNGGPGVTSLLGLFYENGPFSVIKTNTTSITLRQYSWHLNHNIIYIDNPVGTGFSFTDNDAGYATNQNDVGRDLLEALIQFFKLFPELRNNDFYVTGESYAGKYTCAASAAIKNYNNNAKDKINLKGIIIGNGLLHPSYQFIYSEHLYEIGLLDFNEKKMVKEIEDKFIALIQQEKYLEAVKVNEQQRDLVVNITGFDYFLNYLQVTTPPNYGWYQEFVEKPDVRKALHVGNMSFDAYSPAASQHLRTDILQSYATVFADLLNHYKILLYSGQLDIDIPYSMTEKFLMNYNWPGVNEYIKAPRKKWMVENELAGYWKVAGNLTELLVRNAGHLVPTDQPKWAWQLVSQFTSGKSF